MADHLSASERAAIERRLTEIERDPVGYTRFADEFSAIGQLLRYGATADEATLDRMRSRIGLPYLNSLRAAAAKAARANGVTFAVEGDTLHLQGYLPPLVSGFAATQADRFDDELAAMHARFAAVVAALADAGYDVTVTPATVIPMTGRVDQRATVARVAERVAA